MPTMNRTDADSHFIDVLLHDHNHENKIHTVNRWCEDVRRRRRLSTIVDVSQRYDLLASLISTLQQTTNIDYQYNCLMLLSELHGHISHYKQDVYLPGKQHVSSCCCSR
jgi:hypothetical protein